MTDVDHNLDHDLDPTITGRSIDVDLENADEFDFDETNGADDLDAGILEQVEYGQPPPAPFRSPTEFDGLNPVMPRRPEVLAPSEQHLWWTDVTTWTEWAIATFRLTKWFPPCWRAHPALIEEAMALFVGWGQTWLPSIDPTGPSTWLRDLDASLHRIETRWSVACDTDTHKTPTRTPPSQPLPPVTRDWWSSPEFDGIHW